MPFLLSTSRRFVQRTQLKSEVSFCSRARQHRLLFRPSACSASKPYIPQSPRDKRQVATLLDDYYWVFRDLGPPHTPSSSAARLIGRAPLGSAPSSHHVGQRPALFLPVIPTHSTQHLTSTVPGHQPRPIIPRGCDFPLKPRRRPYDIRPSLASS